MSTASSASTGHVSGSSTTPVTSTHKFKGFQVPYILSWKNPYETGTLFAESLALLVVLSSKWTLRYFLKFASTIIGLLSLVEWGSRRLSGQKQGLISSYQPSRFLPISDSIVNDVASYVSYVFRRATLGVQHLLDARDPAKGLRLAGLFYAVFVLLGLFSLKSLGTLTLLLVFTVPGLYLRFQPQVDEAIGEAQEHIHGHARKVHAKIHEKAGPQIQQVSKLFGQRGGFPGGAKVDPVVDVPTAAAQPTAYTSGPSPSTLGSAVGDDGIKVKPADGTGLHTTSAAKTAQDPSDVFKNFDSVPTLAGNVPIDHEKLQASLAADKAKAEGAVNGL